MTPDERALLAGVLAHPDADLPRLVYADWLDDNARDDTCAACGGEAVTDTGRGRVRACPSCDGTGVTSDRRRERAEFIRLQCGLPSADAAHTSTNTAECGCERCRMNVRQAGLFLTYGKEWFRPGPLATVPVYNGPPSWTATPAAREAFVERGFVYHLRCPLAWWVGGECGRCESRGTVMQEGSLPIEWYDTCPTCHGTGRTPGHGPEVTAIHPVTRVTVTDKVPDQYEQSRFAWWRQGGNIDTPQAELPSDVMDALPETGAIHHFDLHSDYLTRADADVALSAALIVWANKRLPKPPEAAA